MSWTFTLKVEGWEATDRDELRRRASEAIKNGEGEFIFDPMPDWLATARNVKTQTFAPPSSASEGGSETQRIKE